ncbi:hypothetical protein C2R90_00090 [Helicobacter pylori]|nr:hypothetical protein C2R90_00090 [Helicobacter pylori]
MGRPSTYVSYLPTLVKREYISISQDKKHIITPTHKGKRVVEVFENAYQFIIDLTYTKQMEEVLDEIVENKSSYVDFINQNNANESVFLMDNLLSERIAYKRSVSEGMGVMEYNDNKAKNEWSQFYDELNGYLGGKK